jgi:hypothetical protein
MIDRQLARDVALAVLLGLPTAALSRPQAPNLDHPQRAAPLVEQAALADQSSTERRFSIEKQG